MGWGERLSVGPSLDHPPTPRTLHSLFPPRITPLPPLLRLDFDEETHGDAFLAPKGSGGGGRYRDSRRVLRPDYASLKRVMADMEAEEGQEQHEQI